MRKKINNIFIKDILTLSSAPFLTQIIGFITLPIFTRIFLPESFGEFSKFYAFFGPWLAIGCLGYEPSIVLPKKKKDALSILIFCILFTLSSSLIFFFIILIFEDHIISIIQINSNNSWLIYLVPILFLFSGLSNSFRYLNLRNKNFFSISFSIVGSTSLDKVTIFIFAFFGNISSIPLIFGGFIDILFRAFSYSISIMDEIIESFKSFNISDIKRNLIIYKNFLLFSFPTNLFSRATLDIPVIIIGWYFLSSTVAFYTISLKLLTLPVKLIGNAIGEVYFERESKNDKISKSNLKGLFNYMVFISLFPFIVLSILGQEIFSIILGNDWIIAGYYSQILSFYIFSMFITIPINYILIILKKQKIIMFLNIGKLFITVFSIYLGSLLNNFELSIYIISFSLGFIILLLGFKIMNDVGVTIYEIFKIFLKYILVSSPFVILLILMKFTLKFNSIFLVLFSVIFTLFYYIICFKIYKTNLDLKYG